MVYLETGNRPMPNQEEVYDPIYSQPQLLYQDSSDFSHGRKLSHSFPNVFICPTLVDQEESLSPSNFDYSGDQVH